ncbi:MAG: hypothetical protein WCE72_21260 [Pseudolabrys sp.]
MSSAPQNIDNASHKRRMEIYAFLIVTALVMPFLAVATVGTWRTNTLASVNEHVATTRAKVGVSDLLRGTTSELLTPRRYFVIVASAEAVPSLSRDRGARVYRGLQKIVR